MVRAGSEVLFEDEAAAITLFPGNWSRPVTVSQYGERTTLSVPPGTRCSTEALGSGPWLRLYCEEPSTPLEAALDSAWEACERYVLDE